MTVNIRGLGTATPSRYATQSEAYQFFTTHLPLEPSQRELYRRILLNGKIRGRYLGLDDDMEIMATDPDQLLNRFLKFGRQVAATAARRALDEAGVAVGDITGLVINTCTGYLCPGLTSYLASDLRLPTTIRALDLMGMGCGAALPNLEAAAGLLARSEQGPVLSIAVEICSATIFPSHEPELILSNAIFGDGAAAAVLDRPGQCHPGGLARIVDFEANLQPRFREDLRYRHQGGRLRNYLSKRVPVIGARTVSEVVDRLLARHGLSREDINWWAVHPGGTLVLEQVAKKLNLPSDALRFSHHIFEKFGNMSSPSVLFVLREILDKVRPRPGQKGLLLAFGAGFSAYGALVEFASA
mgnify:CR=1 FL=1